MNAERTSSTLDEAEDRVDGCFVVGKPLELAMLVSRTHHKRLVGKAIGLSMDPGHSDT
jgi:hypothetical protein